LGNVQGRALATDGQVTLVITTFDRPAYLEECLASVRQQTLRPFRVVVLDNASLADYSGVLDRFRELPLVHVRSETNIGAAGNIGRAIRRYSDSKYLVVFHDDDLMHPRMLEWERDLLERDPDIQFVSTELASFEDGTASPVGTWPDVDLRAEVYDDQTDLARSLLGGAGLCFGSTMYRSSVLSRIGIEEERFGIIWDRPFLLDAARLGKSALIRAPLVLYRRHPGQDTNTGRLSAKNLIELMRAYRAALPENWPRADQELFYRHATYFLTRYGYARLESDQRIGAMAFLRESIRNKVLRVRDLRPGGLEIMMRADGRRVLPAAIDAARRAKRWLSSRGRQAEADPQPLPGEQGQGRDPKK
jgi:glycosyltransferase involved in cell wall biosynthesis